MTITSGGIKIFNMQLAKAPKKQTQDSHVMERYVFVPYQSFVNSAHTEVNLDHSLIAVLQIVMENSKKTRHLVVAETSEDNSLKESILKIVKSELGVTTVEFVDSKTPGLDLLVVSSNELNKSFLDNLKKDFFVLYYGDTSFVELTGMDIVYQNMCEGTGIFLLRESKHLSSYSAIRISNTDLTWLDQLRQLIAECDTDIVCLYSENEDTSGILGLVKCLTLEITEKIKIKCVFIMDNGAERFSLESNFYREQLRKNLTYNVLRNGVWGSFRHLPLKAIEKMEVSHAINLVQTTGDLSSLSWVERPSYYYKHWPSSELVYVFYSALNFKDVMIATGKIAAPLIPDPTAPDTSIGVEFSGLTTTGKRVMGIVYGNSLGLQVVSDPAFTWEVPKSWSLEDAATVPTVYATCFYAMSIKGEIQPGESILIHAGTGGVGLAAISIALSMNCDVFTTVGSQEKRNFLKYLFPNLKLENIGYSRDASFEEIVKTNTEGRGVDIILNSLSADLFQASLRCLGKGGRLLEIGKVDVESGTPISASRFDNNSSFHTIYLDELLFDNCNLKLKIHQLVSEGITTGVVLPLPRTVFSEDKVEDAFRFLASGKHKGKVLIKIREETDENLKSPHRTIGAIPRLYFCEEKSYILIGGLGGFGLEVASFLIKRNAKKIVLNSRRAPYNGYQMHCLKCWSEIDGVIVKVNTDDTTTLEGAEALVRFAESMGPVGGIFNMALVLQDNLLVNQTAKSFRAVFKSKIVSAFNMDSITRRHCSQLDHFVVFSSAVSGRGNPGQTNYGMANSSLERLCEKRHADGIPGLAIQWGSVGDVGRVAESSSLDRILRVFGFWPQRISSCLSALETFMLQPYPVGASYALKDQETESKNSSKRTIAEIAAYILGIRDISKVDKKLALSQMGLDSLMVAEMKQTFFVNFDIDMSSHEIRNLTFSKLETMSGCADRSAVEREPTFINMPMLSAEAVIQISKNDHLAKIIFLLHPIEGNVNALVPLGEKLKATVYGLQCTKEVKFCDMESYAEYFLNKIRNIQEQGPYIICGYSFGAVVAFEIGVQLEKFEETVTLVCLDGSPMFSNQILQYLYVKENKNLAAVERIVLRVFTKYFQMLDQKKLEKIFEEQTAWESLFSIVINLIVQNTSYSAQDVEISANKYYQRLKAAGFYNPQKKLKGNVFLFRSDNTQLPPDYNLQEICVQQVKVHQLKGNHQEIVTGDDALEIVNFLNSLLI